MITAHKSLKSKRLIEVSLCCFGLMIFSLFIHSAFPLILISLAGLTISGYIISGQIFSFRDFLQEFGLTFPRRIVLYLIIGLELGLIYSIIYRDNTGMEIFPNKLHQFALIAALIGTIEELIFRGFIQGQAGKINKVFGLLFASFAHTAYKCCLFIIPVYNFEINIASLFLLTFIGGLLFGLLKEISKSVIPAIIAHAVFDILVYGQCLQSPWWVW
jgi:membrane protease YdiL (CAAX protease family)